MEKQIDCTLANILDVVEDDRLREGKHDAKIPGVAATANDIRLIECY